MAPLPHLGTSVNTCTRDTEEHDARTGANARATLELFADQAADAGAPFQGKLLRTDAVDEAIAAAAAEFGCDLIAMVTQGCGVAAELLFGSHAKNVLARSRPALLVLR
jgi:nucleotide-binding universal stress UspA family protein